VFISGNNIYLTSRFCGFVLGSITIFKSYHVFKINTWEQKIWWTRRYENCYKFK